MPVILTMVDTEESPAPDRRSRWFGQHSAAVVAAVVAAVLGGVATAWGENLFDPGPTDLSAQVRELEAEVGELEATNRQLKDELTVLRGQDDGLRVELDDLDAENQGLREENERLRDQAATAAGPEDDSPEKTGAAPDEPAAGPSAVASGIRRQTGSPVQVMLHTCLDLDTTSADWGAASVPQDLCYGDAGVEGVRLTIMSGAPSRADCAARTTWQQTIASGSVAEGMHLCVQTNERRTAYARIAAVDGDAETVAFDVVVWESS
jgi:regulator of replication initiation timing